MKRFLHISLRTLILQLLLLASASAALAQTFNHIPQQVFYSSADGSQEYWYVIRFMNDHTGAIHCDNTQKMLMKATCDADNVTDEFMWKLVRTESSEWYHLVSKTGKEVTFKNDTYCPAEDGDVPANVKLINVSAYEDPNPASYRYAWQIKREGSAGTWTMNPQGGTNKMVEWSNNSMGNALYFELVEPAEGIDLFLQFSAYGRMALYDDGGASPIARQPAKGTTRPTDAGYTWKKIKKTGGYVLRSGKAADRYIKVNADNTLGYTSAEAEATVFTTPASPYYGAGTEDPVYTAERCAYTTADGKAIAINPADGSIVMTEATGTRAAVIHETQEIKGIEPPITGSESSPVWYNITFTATGNKLTVGDEGSVAVAPSSNPFDVSTMWSLEKIDEDKFYIKSHDNGYLAWDEANSCFTATGAKASPAVFHLAETGPDRNVWVLHYVDATGANQFLQPTDAKDKVELAAATDLTKARLTFSIPTLSGNLAQAFEHTPQEVFISDDTHEYWYVIRFFKNTDYAWKDVNGALEINQNVTTTEATNEFMWKLVPSDEDGWYHIVSKTKKYITYLGSDHERRFGLDENAGNAAKLRLIYNANNADKTHAYAWQVQYQGNTTQSMNALGGVPTDRGIGEWGTDDPNNVLCFDLVEEADTDLFLQFSAFGRRALYDDGGSLIVKQPRRRCPGRVQVEVHPFGRSRLVPHGQQDGHVRQI